ncbi:MAG TPA: GGDEF domain-containing protein [Acidimicrobiales bacterium]
MSWRRRRDSERESESVAEPRSLALTATLDRRPDALLSAVTEDLVASETGIEFVYRSLTRLRDRCHADDVVVIVDEQPLGRQAFRAGRDPIDSGWARDLIRNGEPGLHATPVDVDPSIAASVASLCSLAVRLDVARHDSLHDSLTGLLNRRAFDDLLASSCARSERYGWPFSLVLIDLDHFKSVNDRLGHAIGDTTLQTVGAELRARLRAGDVAARIGGDEFALLLPNLDVTHVPDLIKRLGQVVDETVPDAHVTFTAGAASAPDDAVDPRLLYRIADQRLYEGKHQ